ncbi:TPA: hypothetical protein ACH3X2_001599 [Trebouxia sp. C0005]
MTQPLHEKDMNAQGAGSLLERRILASGKPAPQATGVHVSKPQLLQSEMGMLMSASGCIGARNSYAAFSEMGIAEEGKSGNSPAPAPAGPSGTHLQSVEDMLRHLKQNKLTEGRPIKTHRSSTPSDNVCLVGQNSGRIKWIQPSGPRRSGEGTEDEEQGIIAADSTTTGGARVRITLLAAGFVIGPSGASVREISRQTGADIKSWTEKPDHKSQSSRPTRSFVIEGKKRAVVLALDIMCDAVDRYKELCEGRYCGQFVGRIQKVRGVEFSYQPPPRNIVPYAAALKGQHPRLNRVEAAPTFVPVGSVPTTGVTTYSSGQAASNTSSMSAQGADINSDMGEDHHSNALSDDQTAVHSKAEVMQNYLNAQGSAQPHSEYAKPHSSSITTQVYGSQESTHRSTPVSGDMTHATGAFKQCSSTGSRLYTTPHPDQRVHGLPRAHSPSAHGLSPEVTPFADSPKEQGPVSAAGKPVDLVQIKPNVWLPVAVVQQAGGNLDLALHLAAHSGGTAQTQCTDSNPSADSSWDVTVIGNKPFTDSCLLSKHSTGSIDSTSQYRPPNSQLDSKHSAHANIGDSSSRGKVHNSRSAWTPHRHVMADGPKSQPGFDPVIQPPAYHMSVANSGLAAAYTPPNSQSAFSFSSPTISLPAMGSNSTYISPQCVLDNSSLFSYNVTTPEQTAYTRTTHPWYSTPEAGWGHNLTPNGTPNAASYYPELNPSTAKHMSEMYGLGAGAQSMLPHNPYSVGSGGPYWQDPVVWQLLPDPEADPRMQMSHTSMAASMGGHDASPHHPGTSPLPWIQGSHPLLDKC